MSVGRLLPLKGIDIFLRAFARLRRELNVRARAIIVGEGADMERLRYIAHELNLDSDVCFTGYVHNPYAYMARSSLLVLSSRYEGFGNTLVEAMACGVNVVSTDCKSGPREILEDGKWGRLVPVDDAAALSDAMRIALQSPLPAEDLTRRAAYFSVERSAEKYYNVIRKVVK